MYHTIAEFEQDFKQESESTQKVMDALSDASLAQTVADGHRTLGRMAWHVVTSYTEMMPRTGLEVSSIDPESPVPGTADEIKKAYATVSRELSDKIKEKWTDELLQQEDDMYGMKWKKGVTLGILIRHEIHHRGQMTVLMRQAGLKVPGVYGPALEEWSEYGMKVPEF